MLRYIVKTSRGYVTKEPHSYSEYDDDALELDDEDEAEEIARNHHQGEVVEVEYRGLDPDEEDYLPDDDDEYEDVEFIDEDNELGPAVEAELVDLKDQVRRYLRLNRPREMSPQVEREMRQLAVTAINASKRRMGYE